MCLDCRMALWVRIPYLDQTLSFLGSAFKIALFYIIIVARPISEFGVQPAIELHTFRVDIFK